MSAQSAEHARGRWKVRWGLNGKFGPVFLVSLLTFGPYISPVQAANWTVTPSLAASEIYTDNVALASSGEDSEFVTVVVPGVSILGQGGRIDLSLDYRLEAVLFPSGDFDNDFNHQARTTGKAELVEQLLFFDVDGAISQFNANNTSRQSTSNISQTGNRINSFNYRVSPYLVNRFGSFAQSELRYGFEEIINEGTTVDSETHELRAQIDSGSRFARWPWQIFAKQRETDFDNGIETKYYEAGSSLRYVFGRNFSVFGRGGYESQDFGTIRKNEEGVFWLAGATWTPSSRTKFEGGYGERYFGSNYFFTISHESRRTMLQASFKEDAALASNLSLASQLTPGTLARLPTNLLTPTSEVVVKQRFSGSITFTGRRTNLDLSGFHEDRDFQTSGDKETVFGASTTISRNLSQRMTARVTGRWEESKFRNGVREDTRWEANVGITRSLGPKSNGSIEYGYTDLDSNQLVNEFQENRITLTLSVTF